ncbi:MAG: hypothetical protein AAGC57_13545 [Pseudomonadota bacterium]
MNAAMAVLLAGSLTEPGLSSVQPPNMETVHGCLEADFAADGSGEACVPLLMQPCREAAKDPRIDVRHCIRRLTRGWQGELKSRARTPSGSVGELLPRWRRSSEATIFDCILKHGPRAAGTIRSFRCQMVGFARGAFLADRDPQRFHRGPGTPA